MSDSRPLLPPPGSPWTNRPGLCQAGSVADSPPGGCSPKAGCTEPAPGAGKGFLFCTRRGGSAPQTVSPWKGPSSYFKLTTKENEF